MEQQVQKKEEQLELQRRLTAPTHITFSHFSRHDKIEGYFERDDDPQFMGCDRLLKLENMFGRLQMGYDPKKGVSFLFAHLKTNLYDTVASAYQKKMNDRSRIMQQKRVNENVAFNARRKNNTAIMLYKKENKPWSESSIQPYLRRQNAGALRKTMPFLNRLENETRLQALYDKQRFYKAQAAEQAQEGQSGGNMQARVSETWREIEQENVTLWRKDQLARGFFRKLNYAFDIQKHEMFDYYREKRKKQTVEAENDTLSEPTDSGDTEKE